MTAVEYRALLSSNEMLRNWWWFLYSSLTTLKIPELCPLNGWIMWCVNYISTWLLLNKKNHEILRMTDNPMRMVVMPNIPLFLSSSLHHLGPCMSNLSKYNPHPRHHSSVSQRMFLSRRAVVFYLSLFDQLMEFCQKFCNAGISRHQGHGTWGTWSGEGNKREPH